MIRKGSGYELTINGEESGSFLGEHVWISRDRPMPMGEAGARRLQEGTTDETDEMPAEEAFMPNHWILGVTSRSLEDDLDHVNFYKLIENEDGSYTKFDFGIDIIQTVISPAKHSS